MAAFRKQYRYRFGDIDDAGIAYYPKLLHYLHCAMEDWWADGIGVRYPDVMRDERYGLPTARVDVEFFEPVRYGDEPWVHVGVLRVGRSSVDLGFWMSRSENGPPLCRMRAYTVGVDLDTMRPVPVPEHWRAAFGRFAIAEAEFPGRTRG